jgi:predicted GNAT superfamily acetyltransferase
VLVRPLEAPWEFRRLEELQGEIWGLPEREVVPYHQFVAAAKAGGVVLGAFDGESLVGFSYGFPAWQEGRAYLWSHMTGVLPQYQGRGWGPLLKWEQRRQALARGYKLIRWTFDPLQAQNAYFNLHKLGAVVTTYLPDCYGEMGDRVNRGLPSDRLVADWYLDSPWVKVRCGEEEEEEGVAWWPRVRRVAVPERIGELKGNDPEAARRERLRVRRELSELLGAGYVACGFAQGAYLLVAAPLPEIINTRARQVGDEGRIGAK